MATPINLNKKLQPNDSQNYYFRINLTIGQLNSISKSFQLLTPPAAPLMNRVGSDFTYKIIASAGDTYDRSITWQFDRFIVRKSSDQPNNPDAPNTNKFLQIRIPISGNDDFEVLKRKTQIKFNTNGSFHLDGIHDFIGEIFNKKLSIDKNFWIVSIQLLKKNNNNPWDMDSGGGPLGKKPINKSYEITGVNRSIILEREGEYSNNIFYISVQPSITNNLIKKIAFENNNIKIGSVHDILVFTYKQYGGTLNSKIKMKYLTDSAKANPDNDKDPNVKEGLKNILTYEDAKKYNLDGDKQKNNFKVKFDPKNGKKVIIYATIIRYVYKINPENPTGSPEWIGEWLQINTQDEPIWGRAVVSGEN